jgi:hypothetical protein
MSEMPDHLFVSSADGALYDTRVAKWSTEPPLRANYRRGRRDIESCADLKATLRAGRYTDLGCYPLYFLASDGESLSFEAVRDNLRIIMGAIQSRDDSGWRVVACDVNWEDSEMVCAHTGKPIESAYGDAAEEESSV